MNERDDFSESVKRLLSARVAGRCSHPECGQITSGPQVDPKKALNIGVAAHITAASPDGPRYDPTLTPEQRKDITNGIWCCQNHGKLVDNDATRYTVDELRRWKSIAEAQALRDVEAGTLPPSPFGAVYMRLERDMAPLLAEMRADLASSPFVREFIVFKRGLVYNHNPRKQIFTYYHDDHDSLLEKMQILENHGLVVDARFNDVPRWHFTEEFVDYLKASATGGGEA